MSKAQADAVTTQRAVLRNAMTSLARMSAENDKIEVDYQAAVQRYRKAKLVPLDTPVIPLTH